MPGAEIIWVPVTRIERPTRRGFYEVLVDCWWVIDAEQNAAMWQRGRNYTPIANADRTIVERVGLPTAAKATDLNVATMRIALAHVPHYCEDY